jgi:hypothetical protein
MLSALAFLLGAYDIVVEPPVGPKSTLDWNKPISCLTLAPSKQVPSGEYRVQCDEAQHTCFAAPTRVLVDGVEGDEPLARVNEGCFSYVEGASAQSIEQHHWRFEEAIAEAPPGWYRDERGRVMQVNFDLGRRVFLGGAWAPYYRPDGTGFVLPRARVEFGIAVNSDPRGENVQHRWHFLETTAWLGRNPLDTRFEASVVRYELSRRRQRAPLWITTFVGEPRRFDLPLNFGFAAEAGRFESLGAKNFVTIAELDVTLDLWNSADLDSFVRLRAGPALEYDFDAKGAYLRPAVALEGDLTLDRDGFHHLTASVAGEKLIFEPAVEGRGASPQRLRIKAGYEVILVALNDYPLTLVVDGRAAWRDDVPALKGWDFSANVGLRFSLWAPARHLSQQVRTRPAVVGPPPPVANPPAVVPAPAVEPAPQPVPEQPAPAPERTEDGLTDTERLIRAAKQLRHPK